jgi:hypothetical protein
MQKMPGRQSLHIDGGTGPQVHPGWQADQAFRRQGTEFGECAGIFAETGDWITDGNARHAVTQRRDPTCKFQPRHQRITFWMRIDSDAHHQIRIVEAGIGHLDQNLPRTGDRFGNVPDKAGSCGLAGRGKDDCAHDGNLWHGGSSAMS